MREIVEKIVVDFFKEEDVLKEEKEYAVTLWNWEEKDMRMINDAIADRVNYLAEKHFNVKVVKVRTTLYNESMYIRDFANGDTYEFSNNDYSYTIVVDKSWWGNTLEEYIEGYLDWIQDKIIDTFVTFMSIYNEEDWG